MSQQTLRQLVEFHRNQRGTMACAFRKAVAKLDD